MWDEEKQRKYVEFIMRGGQSGKDIYWNCAGWMDTWEGPLYLVDGKQHLESVRKFMRDELVVFDGEMFGEGLVRSDFEENMPLHMGFKFHINDLKEYHEVLQWYLDLNEGSVAHTQDELDKVREMLNNART